jgi:hypothetical protein
MTIRRRNGKFIVRELLDADTVVGLAFDVWEHVRTIASKRLGVQAPPLAAMKMGISYLKIDPDTGERSDVANGEAWTHAEFTLRGTVPVVRTIPELVADAILADVGDQMGDLYPSLPELIHVRFAPYQKLDQPHRKAFVQAVAEVIGGAGYVYTYAVS